MTRGRPPDPNRTIVYPRFKVSVEDHNVIIQTSELLNTPQDVLYGLIIGYMVHGVQPEVLARWIHQQVGDRLPLTIQALEKFNVMEYGKRAARNARRREKYRERTTAHG